MAIAIVITPPFKPLPNKEDGKSGKSASGHKADMQIAA
jgi:hypothetical protein